MAEEDALYRSWSCKECDNNINSRLYASGLLSTAPGASAIGPSSTPTPYKRKLVTEGTKPSRGSGTTTKKLHKNTVADKAKSNRVNSILLKLKVSKSNNKDKAPNNTRVRARAMSRSPLRVGGNSSGSGGSKEFEEFKEGREGGEGEDCSTGSGEGARPNDGIAGIKETSTTSVEDTSIVGTEGTSIVGAEDASAASVKDTGTASVKDTSIASIKETSTTSVEETSAAGTKVVRRVHLRAGAKIKYY
ncbi:hypothetical protein V8E51_018344 [Hyaloscypha variabilis]